MIATYGQGKIVCDRSAPGTIELIRQAGLNAVANESKREDAIRELGGRFIVQVMVNPDFLFWLNV